MRMSQPSHLDVAVGAGVLLHIDQQGVESRARS